MTRRFDVEVRLWVIGESPTSALTLRFPVRAARAEDAQAKVETALVNLFMYGTTTPPEEEGQ
jgi:hypothetical protein